MTMTNDDDQARHRAETKQSARDSTAVLITSLVAGTVVTIALVAGVVALSLAGRELAVIVGLIGPVAAAAALLVAALGKLVSVDRKQDAQSAKLEQVAHQTNGALRAHIDSSIRAALAERDTTPTGKAHSDRVRPKPRPPAQ
jgi:hypothetical protein